MSKQNDCFSFVKNKQRNTCKKCLIESRRKSQDKHRDKYILREKQSRKTDPIKALYHHYRNLPIRFLKEGYKSYECIVGIDHQGFKDYIQSKFKPWMNWTNRRIGPATASEPYKYWTLDHIIPIRSAKSEDEIIELTHYTNIQPICSFINNRIKSGNPKYYDINEWLKMGYWANNREVGYKDVIIMSDFNDQDVLDIWEAHKVKEYLRQVS